MGTPFLDALLNMIENPNTVIIARVKELRVNCDELIQNAAAIKTSAETTLAWRSLQMAKCWMGKLLAELGDESPYHEAENAIGIPEPADVFIGALAVVKYGDRLGCVNRMRQEIQNLIDKGRRDFEIFASPLVSNGVLTHLTEARFWYGFEIQNIKAKNL